MTGTIVGEFKRSVSLSSSASVSSQARLEAVLISGLSGVASFSQVGKVTKFGQAHISNVGAFSQGFTKGLQTGSSLVGRHFISQNHIDAKATITAHAENNTHHEASLPASANLTSKLSLFNYRSRFQSTASLTGNSVLLHGGTVNLRPIATLTPVISSEVENPDIIKITSYINKSNSLALYIDKQISTALYIDKGLSLSTYIDKTKDESIYIDKIVNKTLVRER
jgi:hypothetical protein